MRNWRHSIFSQLHFSYSSRFKKGIQVLMEIAVLSSSWNPKKVSNCSKYLRLSSETGVYFVNIKSLNTINVLWTKTKTHKHAKKGNSFNFYIWFLIHSLVIISQTAVYVYATNRIWSCLYNLNSYDKDQINKIITAFKYVNIVYDYHIFQLV